MYKIKDQTTQIINERSNRTSLAIRYALDGVHKAANPKTPKKRGLLRNNVKKSVLGNKGSISWLQDYAAAQEVGVITIKKDTGIVPPGTYVFKKYTTPGTGAHFAENAAQQELNNPRKYLKMAGL